jgi:hypothetical protein
MILLFDCKKAKSTLFYLIGQKCHFLYLSLSSLVKNEVMLVPGYFAFPLSKINALFLGQLNLYRTNPVPEECCFFLRELRYLI